MKDSFNMKFVKTAIECIIARNGELDTFKIYTAGDLSTFKTEGIFKPIEFKIFYLEMYHRALEANEEANMFEKLMKSPKLLAELRAT